jgi:cellulose biosynthesis protein BcsQ
VRTLAIASLKGGVGKTTVTLGLASAAVRAGLRTLVVDTDPQCNATTALDPPETSKSLADALGDPRTSTLLDAIAANTWTDSLDVLVGAETVEAHNKPDPNTRNLTRLDRALRRLPAYDLVLIDCPPSLGQLTRSALVAAESALLVTEPTMFAVAGVRRAFEAVAAQQGHNPRLDTAGVLINRVKPRSKEHTFRVKELREVFGPALLPITVPDRAALQQAQGACRSIHSVATSGGRECARLFERLLDSLRHPSTVDGRAGG